MALEITFRNSAARGRNGWFKMATSHLSVIDGRVMVEICSKRECNSIGPVFLDMESEDAERLAQAVRDTALLAQRGMIRLQYQRAKKVKE